MLQSSQNSGESVDGSGWRKDVNYTVQQTQKMIDKQNERLERVKRARDNSVALAMERAAK